jgi:hypothetical protein
MKSIWDKFKWEETKSKLKDTSYGGGDFPHMGWDQANHPLLDVLVLTFVFSPSSSSHLGNLKLSSSTSFSQPIAPKPKFFLV